MFHATSSRFARVLVIVTGLSALACSSNSTPAAPAATPPPVKSAPTANLQPEGAVAPDFTAPLGDGSTFKLSGETGKAVVLYFYPKDFTGGCTIEAQSFRDGIADFQKIGAKVVGISLDNAESHKKFTADNSLPFPLVADDGGKIAALYGVDTSGGYAKRVTFVVGPNGKIFKVFPKVNVEGHEAEVLAAAKASLAMTAN